MNNHNPTLEQLQRGLKIAEQIAQLEAAMLAIFQGQPIVIEKSSPAPAKTGKRKLSPQALANIRAAQKRRWAKVNAAKASPKSAAASPAPKAPEKKKRKISPAVRAKLAAAMKARWADAKSGKAPAPTASKGKKK